MGSPSDTVVPQPPLADSAQGRSRQQGLHRKLLVSGHNTPAAALAPPGQELKVGRITAPSTAAEQAERREQNAQLRDSVLDEGLRHNEARQRTQEGGQDLPAWRRVGGEDFERRAQLKDSFTMIWNRERGLQADSSGGKSKSSSNMGTCVYTWGMGFHGQLGKKYARGEIRMSVQPNLVPLPSGIAACQVTCGAFHTMVLTLDGRVFSWGEGRHGQLGYQCLAKQETPMEVTDIDTGCGSYLAAGRHHSAMIDRNGGLWCWGHGRQGQLGDGESPSARHMPKKLTKYKPSTNAAVEDMPTTLRFKQLACGARHTAAVSTDGELFTFGSGKQGQLGHGMPLQDAVKFPTPVEFFSSTSTGNRARFVDASATLTVAVTEDDSAYCWGMADYIHGAGSVMSADFGNAHPPPSDNSTDESEKCLPLPKRICPSELEVQQAQVGQGHILVLSKAGDVFAWGQGSEGEIGSGVKINVHTPRLVIAGKGVQDITVGRYHNACITAYGLIYSWGAGEHGQLGHGLEQSEPLPRLAESLLDCVAGQIACGEQHTAVLSSGRGMQIMAGCEAWRSQEESELRIKEQMVVSLPLGVGARELMSIGPSVRTYIDLFEDERDGRLKDIETKEKDKEVKVESTETIVEETKQKLSEAMDLDVSLREIDMLDGAGSQKAAAEEAQSEEDKFAMMSPVGTLDKGKIEGMSGASHQLLQVRTLHARMKSKTELAEEARKRVAARQAEEERQAKGIALAKIEGWAQLFFKRMDSNQDGALSLDELETGLDAEARLRYLPAGLKFKEAKDLFAAIDTDRSGTLTEDEFTQEVIRVCDLKDAKNLTVSLNTAPAGTSEQQRGSNNGKRSGKGKRGMPAMSMSSKGKGRNKSKSKSKKDPSKGLALEMRAPVDGSGGTSLTPTPPSRINDPQMRAADERVLVAFFAEFQPEFAKPDKVRQIINFYADEHARKSRISPMSSATAGGDYRELMRSEYRRQRGIDPWEWYESVRRAEGWPSATALAGGVPSNPNSPNRTGNSQATPRERFATESGRERVSARKQARARRFEAIQAINQPQHLQRGNADMARTISSNAGTQRAISNVHQRKPSSARMRADGSIRPHSAAALGKGRSIVHRKALDGPQSAASAMTARTASSGTAIDGTRAPVLPGVATPGTGEADEPATTTRMSRRAQSARLQRERRAQMTRSAHHARSHTSAADRVIFKGAQDLRNKDAKAKDHWAALFSPLGPRSDFMRQAGEVLYDSRRTLTHGRAATTRSASRAVSNVSLLRSKLDKTKTILDSKHRKLESLKLEHANLVTAIAIEDDAMKAEHADQNRTETLLETVHTRLMEASENHEELTATYTYMKEHILSLQLLQKERSDELLAAERLRSSLVALKERGEMMASGVMHEVRGLREDNERVRAQFQEAMEQYRTVQKRSRNCISQTQKMMQQRLVESKARQDQALDRKKSKVSRGTAGIMMKAQRQKAQLESFKRCQEVLLEMREQIGDIDLTNPVDVDNIIEKYKMMSKDEESDSASRLVNMSLIQDRQLATRRIEMLRSEQDGLIELLRAGFESTLGPGGDGESQDFYCVSPISYQIIYREDPLLAIYENYVPVQLLFEKAEAEWGFTDSTLVWSERLGLTYTSAARRNGWITWGEFKKLRKAATANILSLEELRCGHPSRTMLTRSVAEHQLLSSSLALGAEVEQKKTRLMTEVHVSLNIVSMMKPLGLKSQLWLGDGASVNKQSAPESASASASTADQRTSQVQTSFYTLVFAIARKLDLPFIRNGQVPSSPRARKMADGRLPLNNGDDMVGVIRTALDKLGLPSSLLGSFADIRAGNALSMRELVAKVCHHPKIAIRTGWPEYAAVEKLDESLQAPPSVILEHLEEEVTTVTTASSSADEEKRDDGVDGFAPLSFDKRDGDHGDSAGTKESALKHDWTLAPADMEPLACLEDLEQTLSILLNSLAAIERLKKALGKEQEHRLTGLLEQTGAQLREQKRRHPSAAITKATLRDYCLTAEAIRKVGALEKELLSEADTSSPADMVDEAAKEVRKAELRAAYLAWDVSTVDYGALLEAAQDNKEARKCVQATFHGAHNPASADTKENNVPAGVGVLKDPEGHSGGTSIHVAHRNRGKHKGMNMLAQSFAKAAANAK